jgi:hypothetical protein
LHGFFVILSVSGLGRGRELAFPERDDLIGRDLDVEIGAQARGNSLRRLAARQARGDEVLRSACQHRHSVFGGIA